MNRIFRNMSISVKATIALILSIVLILGGNLIMSLNQLHTLSIDKGSLEGRTAGVQYATNLQTRMSHIHGVLQSFAQQLAVTREDQSLSREQVIAIMEHKLNRSSDLFGIYTLWEPNAFDSNDEANVNKAQYDDASGRFVPYLFRKDGQIQMEASLDYEASGAGDYYWLPKESKKVTYIDPYVYEAGGVKTNIMSVTQPILSREGEFLGIVGIDLTLEQMEQDAAQYKPMGGYVSLLTGSGTYVANPNDPESIMQHYGDNPQKEELWQKVIAGESLEGFTLNSKGNRVLRVFEPISMPGSDQVWYTQASIPESTIMGDYYKARSAAIITSVVGIALLIGILMFMIQRLVTKPLRVLSGKLQLMAQGDLTQQMLVRSGDEIGVMSGYFNDMTAKLREMFKLVSDLSMAVGATSEQLSASAEQNSSAAHTVAVSVGRIAEGAMTQNEQASESARSMNEMKLGAGRIAEFSSSVSSTADDVTNQTKAGSERLEATVSEMGEVVRSVEVTEDSIKRLEERSEQIVRMIDMISNISTQTNLLALNAAIEASRVGEHGRGFAVVAAEIRKLADQTKQAAEEVTSLVEAVRKDTSIASTTMAAGGEKVRSGMHSIHESQRVFELILSDMSTVNVQIQEVSASAQQMSASTDQVTDNVSQLADLASMAAADSQSVAAASEEQLASMEEIAASSAALSKMVEELLEKLSQFKI
ncbi:methyl-accepting chemotaxis protein [Paenibacillus sp. PL2-23]|uniref:methyl-accepting chemotaxis protein n=1 Tax=Paenibacillus sp. PL2-23 TaxID=2100729 RepID=UPI0030F6F24B